TNSNRFFALIQTKDQGSLWRSDDGGEHWHTVNYQRQLIGRAGYYIRIAVSTGNDNEIYVANSSFLESDRKSTRLNSSHVAISYTYTLSLHDALPISTNSNRFFALIQTKDQGSLWRSDDGGEHWHTVNYQRQLIGRAGYYIRIAVSTGNDNEIYVANSSFLESLDGGETFKEVPWGGDNHDIWIDPLNPDRFVITDDAGLSITTVHGRGFHHVTLPIGQMYHVAVDNQVPYYVYSNMQDGPNMRGPSLPLGGGPIEIGWERRMGGCESGFTLPDPQDPNIVWSSCYANEVTRWDARIKRARSVSPWIHTLDSPPNELKYRCHWTPPLAIDPFDHNN